MAGTLPVNAPVPVAWLTAIVARLAEARPAYRHVDIALVLHRYALDAPYKTRQAVSARLSNALAGREGVSVHRARAWREAAQAAGANIDGLEVPS